MAEHPSEVDRLEAELARLGFRLRDMPNLAFADGQDGVERFLGHLRSLEPGATFHDIFPELPAHWLAGRPETWTSPYAPFGSYDYPDLPTGPAAHLLWGGPVEDRWWDDLVIAARAAGWPIHGAGPAPGTDPGACRHALVVLDRATPEATLDAFVEWVQGRERIVAAFVSRRGDEAYYSPPDRGSN